MKYNYSNLNNLYTKINISQFVAMISAKKQKLQQLVKMCEKNE